MTEAGLQRSIAAQLEWLLEPPVIWTAIQPERRGPIEGKRMKSKGVHAGWPDFLILAPGPRILGIELKVKIGVLSQSQKHTRAAFEDCKALYIVCRTPEAVVEALDRAGIRHRQMRTVGSTWERVT